MLPIIRSVLAIGMPAALLAVTTSAQATCYSIAGTTPRFIPAAFGSIASVPRNHVRIDFIGHGSFEIESPAGVRIVTDFNGYLRPSRLPQIVTMNTQSETHSTEFTDPAIKYVLKGWNPAGGVAKHNLRFKDVRVRNVPTNLQNWSGRISNDSSMFVFDVSDLCIVHLGNLRHVLTRDFVAQLGRVDIALVPIDGTYTMSYDELFDVLKMIKPALIIPMQFGSAGGAEEFVARARKLWPVRRHSESWIQLSFRDLPRQSEVMFLRGGF